MLPGPSDYDHVVVPAKEPSLEWRRGQEQWELRGTLHEAQLSNNVLGLHAMTS